MEKKFESEHTGATFPKAWHVATGVNINKNPDGTFRSSIQYSVYVDKDMYAKAKNPIGNYNEDFTDVEKVERAFNILTK